LAAIRHVLPLTTESPGSLPATRRLGTKPLAAIRQVLAAQPPRRKAKTPYPTMSLWSSSKSSDD